MTVYAEDVVENDNTEKKLSSETEEDKKALESHDNVVIQSSLWKLYSAMQSLWKLYSAHAHQQSESKIVYETK